jgi:hypothetical protein
MSYYIRQNTKYTSSGHYFRAFRAHNAILPKMVRGFTNLFRFEENGGKYAAQVQ